jgi:hypothetical protein
MRKYLVLSVLINIFLLVLMPLALVYAVGVKRELNEQTISLVNNSNLDVQKFTDDLPGGHGWKCNKTSLDSVHGSAFLISDNLGERVVTEYDIKSIELLYDK